MILNTPAGLSALGLLALLHKAHGVQVGCGIAVRHIDNGSDQATNEHEEENQLPVNELLHLHNLNGLVEKCVAEVLALGIMVENSQSNNEVTGLQTGIWHELVLQAELLARLNWLMVDLLCEVLHKDAEVIWGVQRAHNGCDVVLLSGVIVDAQHSCDHFAGGKLLGRVLRKKEPSRNHTRCWKVCQRVLLRLSRISPDK
mmetsp:Transcript_36631/g.81525  ORF Transcript_36631/g.81525 Transcript_36631/m.81525 type:complete len:200 (+) Transcript_36631:751-1350(+)